jgi:hypothetical protein
MKIDTAFKRLILACCGGNCMSEKHLDCSLEDFTATEFNKIFSAESHTRWY